MNGPSSIMQMFIQHRNEFLFNDFFSCPRGLHGAVNQQGIPVTPEHIFREIILMCLLQFDTG